MATSEANDRSPPKREVTLVGSPSETNHDPTVSDNELAAIGYPSVMGYPPQYPGNPYVTSHQHSTYPTQPQPPPQPRYGYINLSAARRVIATVIVFGLFLCIASMIIHLVLRPSTPTFQISTFSVSNFNITDSILMANWVTNVTVENPNKRLTAYFDKIRSIIYYNDPRECLSWSSEEAFMLGRKDHTVLYIASNSVGQMEINKPLLQEIGKERSNGTLDVVLDIATSVTFKHGSWWTRHINIRVCCEDIKVIFEGTSSLGALAEGGGINRCSTYQVK